MVEGLVVSFPSTNGTNINEPMKRSVQGDTPIDYVFTRKDTKLDKYLFY